MNPETPAMNPDIARARDLLQDSAMDPALRTSTARAAQQRLRFEALRRRVFSEQEEGSARWRLMWMLPFQLGIVALLILGGESHGRAAAQVIVVAVNALLFILRTRSPHPVLRKFGILVGVATYFVLLMTTGGLASPLLIMTTILLAAAAFTVHDPRWLKPVVFFILFGGMVTLSLVWRSALTGIPYPLADANGITALYVVVAFITTVFVMMGVYRMGCQDDARLRARGPRAGRAARGAVQRGRGPVAGPRGSGRAPRPRGEEPAGRHQGPVHAHGAQRDRREDGRATRHRRRRGRPAAVDRRRLPLVLARAGRPGDRPGEAARDRPRARRAAGDARRGGGREARGDGRPRRCSSTPTAPSSGRRCSTWCSTPSRPRRAAPP